MPWLVDGGHECPSLPEAVAVNAHAWLLTNLDEPWQMFDDWFVFGHAQGNRFDFIFNEDRSANLSARVDVGSRHDLFISTVCELASVTGCLLFSAEHWSSIEPTVAELSSSIRASRAFRYVRDPRSVLGGTDD